MPKMEETAVAAGAELLPDDLVLEVLARVLSTDNVAALFRCAVACKRWRALITDLSLLRRRWPEKTSHPSSLLGYFVQQPRCDDSNSGLFRPVFIPPPYGSALGSHRRSLASFIPGLPYDELDGAVPLTARHGLLLVRLARRANDEPARLAVCNLLAGTCVALPPLKPGVSSVNCAIVTGADCQRHSSDDGHGPLLLPDFFKVLAIVANSSRGDYQECNNLYTFSSVEPCWSEPRNCLDVFGWSGDGERHHDVIEWRNKVVVCRGMAHWLVLSMSKYYILGVSIETSDISVAEVRISIPEKPPLSTRRYYVGWPTLIVTAAGSPSLFWLQEEGLSLGVWTKVDDDDRVFRHARTVELKPPKVWSPSSVHVWSGEKSGVLLIMEALMSVHMVDLESGAMEDVSELFRAGGCWGMMPVPMEVDWPALFRSRLGGG